MKRFGTMLAAACVSAALLMPSAAYAVSYPCVDDVNEWNGNRSCLTVTAVGEGSLKLTAKGNGKKLKVEKHHRGVWTVVVRNGERVVLTVRDKNESRSIEYRLS